MLKEVYLNMGLGGTMLVGALALTTAFAWFAAIAGVMVRPMSRRKRVALTGLLAISPPAALVLLTGYAWSARREIGQTSFAKVSAAIPGAPRSVRQHVRVAA